MFSETVLQHYLLRKILSSKIVFQTQITKLNIDLSEWRDTLAFMIKEICI